MATKKVGTVVDEELLRRAKVTAAREGIPFSQLLEKALQAYLRPKKESIAAATRGAMHISPSVSRQVMEEEESYLPLGEESFGPVAQGGAVHVTPAESTKYPLRGLPFTYVDPTEPVAEKEWEAAS